MMSLRCLCECIQRNNVVVFCLLIQIQNIGRCRIQSECTVSSRRRRRSELILASARQHHMLISEEKYFESNMIKKELRHNFDVFVGYCDRSKCLHATSSNALIYMHYVGNVVYHKFSHGALTP